MARKRPKGVLEIGWACFESAATGRIEHVPTAVCYPETLVRRTSVQAGGGHAWRISALTTPRKRAAPWKIVVVTGAPSWAEYWAPVLAALPANREMLVVDRPGFAGSEPVEYVGDIRVQAAALAPLLETAPGQRLMLVGQSYGAAIAALMAAAAPRRVRSLVLLSGYFGESGPTAKRLVDWGSKLLAFIPRDLKNAVREVAGQPSQIEHLHRALEQATMPVHLIHGTRDDFAPLAAAERLFARIAHRSDARFQTVEGADHFLNDGPPDDLLALLEACLPARGSELSIWLREARDQVNRRLAALRRRIAPHSARDAAHAPVT
ncbi:alpha/beta fold hydrolase [Caulobacter mirabilis]|uniref:alpha/beta fold hydrolase n=1 Tax=Caulobacter mirabilis TaxID=69666 RepID=UPI001559B998|nr:alpha/beta hydrolase [Caulobacter mirabilis]